MQSRRKVLTPIMDFSKVREAVVDVDGCLIIPKYMMQDQERYLSSMPTIPVRGLLLVEYLIAKHIESCCQHTKTSHYNNKIDSQILDGYHHIHYDGLLDRSVESISAQVTEFMRRDNWHVYFTRRIQQDIMVEKTIDYRIYDWTRIQAALLAPEDGSQ